ncbi:hypothetical protein D3C71_2216020 [compost metagenome]
MPGLIQANGKNRRYRRRYNAAGGYPGEQGAFTPVQVRARSRQRDVQGAGNELDDQ